jgi:hypothetical protein
MQGTTPQTYTIADFLKWNDDKELVLNPKFQRGSVWSSQARTYLIDSILRGYPIPKLLLRTEVDRDSRRTIRDVVDGQQRLRTIIDFASGKLTLGAKAKEFRGDRYDTLDGDLKDSFLSYKLTCEQLLNATDDDVLEVFVRINSYAIPVSEAELRNARFDTDFSDLVKELSPQLGAVWSLGVISERERVRMVDQTFVAEAFAFLDRGVITGSEADITRFYEQTRTRDIEHLPGTDLLRQLLDETSELVVDLANEPLVQRPHFLMLLAAVMYARGVLPAGRLDMDSVPSPNELLVDDRRVRDSLAVLNTALASDQPGARFQQFREARASTQRMKSRQTRFEHFCQALTGRYAE